MSNQSLPQDQGIAVAVSEPPSTNVTVVREIVQEKPKKEVGSIVGGMARNIITPIALILDVFAMLIRIAETTIQLTLPEAYVAWSAHTDPVMALAYYISAIIVIVAISIGVTASLFLVMPLLYQIEKRIEAAHKVRNRRTRKEMLTYLGAKKKRYTKYTAMAASVPVLFGVSYFLAQQGIDFLKYVTAAADIAAPIIVLFVLAQSEREHKDSDPQEEAVQIATGVVLDNMRQIKKPAGGLLKKEEAAMLQAGVDADIEQMITSITPHDEKDNYYTIVEICKRLNVSTERDSRDRKKIYRIVARAVRDGEKDIRRDSKGRGYLVPGKLFDKLFGDYLLERPSKNEPVDTHRTNDVSYAAPGAGQVGQSEDNMSENTAIA